MAKLERAAPTKPTLPPYPGTLRQSKAGGCCVVGFTITPKGRVQDVFAIEGDDPAAQMVSIMTVAKWSFPKGPNPRKCYVVFDFVFDRATGKAEVRLR